MATSRRTSPTRQLAEVDGRGPAPLGRDACCVVCAWRTRRWASPSPRGPSDRSWCSPVPRRIGELADRAGRAAHDDAARRRARPGRARDPRARPRRRAQAVRVGATPTGARTPGAAARTTGRDPRARPRDALPPTSPPSVTASTSSSASSAIAGQVRRLDADPLAAEERARVVDGITPSATGGPSASSSSCRCPSGAARRRSPSRRGAPRAAASPSRPCVLRGAAVRR